MDRAIQLEKKFTNDASSSENNIEVQSLQIIGELIYMSLRLTLSVNFN
jgi:hypothetical protein